MPPIKTTPGKINFLYSATTASFVDRVKFYIREILTTETDLVFAKSRIVFRNYSYPLSVVVYENSSSVGIFNPNLFQIGLNKKLMFTAKTEVIKNIIRHELAHYITYLIFQDDQQDHGPVFKSICKQYGWQDEVSMATLNLEATNDKIEGDLPSEKIIEKVKKLLALEASSNQHESELAMIMANKLIMEHNLSSIRNNPNVQLEETTYVKRILTASKITGKHRAMRKILMKFLVEPIYNYGRGLFYLEVIGTKTNVEIANYVGNFLNHELEKIWDAAKLSSNKRLGGITQKNSFMLGIADGFVAKIERLEKENSRTNATSQTDLTILKSSLSLHVERAYPKLRCTRFSSNFCSDANNQGAKAGEQLSIHAALSGNGKSNSSGEIFLLN